MTELRLPRPSPLGLQTAEGRGVQGAGRYRGGARASALASVARRCASPAGSLRSPVACSRPRRPVQLAL